MCNFKAMVSPSGVTTSKISSHPPRYSIITISPKYSHKLHIRHYSNTSSSWINKKIGKLVHKDKIVVCKFMSQKCLYILVSSPMPAKPTLYFTLPAQQKSQMKSSSQHICCTGRYIWENMSITGGLCKLIVRSKRTGHKFHSYKQHLQYPSLLHPDMYKCF
jgi:hypothetical protein